MVFNQHDWVGIGIPVDLSLPDIGYYLDGNSASQWLVYPTATILLIHFVD